MKEVAQRYSEGAGPLEIAQAMNLSPNKVRSLLKDAIAFWRTQIKEDIDKRRLHEAIKLDMVEQEAWDAWNASKGIHKQVTETIEMAQEFNIKNIPKTATYEGEAIPTFRPTRTVRSEKIYGELGCLRAILECIASRRKMFGLDAPQRTAIENPDGTALLAGIKVIEVGRNDAERELGENTTPRQTSLPS